MDTVLFLLPWFLIWLLVGFLLGLFLILLFALYLKFIVNPKLYLSFTSQASYACLTVNEVWPDIPIVLSKYNRVRVFFSRHCDSCASASLLFPYIVLGKELGNSHQYLATRPDNLNISYLLCDYIRFIFFHELYHVIKKHGFRIRHKRIVTNEVEADHFAADLIGKKYAVDSLEKIRADYILGAIEIFKKTSPGTLINPDREFIKITYADPSVIELDLRIMAFYMPTLFRRYAS